MFWHLFYLVAGWATFKMKLEHLDSSIYKKRDLSSYGFLTGRVFKHACEWLFRWFHPVNKHLQQRPVKSRVGQTAAPTQQLKKGQFCLLQGAGSLPDWSKDAPLSSSWRRCPDPIGRKNGCGVCWRSAARPGYASWCCSPCERTPEGVKIS